MHSEALITISVDQKCTFIFSQMRISDNSQHYNGSGTRLRGDTLCIYTRQPFYKYCLAEWSMDAIVLLLRFPVLPHEQTLAPHSEAFYHVLCNISMYCNDWYYNLTLLSPQHLTRLWIYFRACAVNVACVQGICSFLLEWKQLNQILKFLSKWFEHFM